MIRRLLPSDASLYQNIRLESLQTSPVAFVWTYSIVSHYPPTHFSQTISSYTSPPFYGYYGQFDPASKMLGILSFYPYDAPKLHHTAEIGELFVKPTHRGQNIASSLITHVINLAHSTPRLEQLHLKVLSRNQPAINFYQKHGFRLTATRPKTIKETDGTYQDELNFCLYLKN